MSGKNRRGRGVDATGRSKGGDKHVRLHRWLLQSPAWQELSFGARALLIVMYDLHNGQNNGTILVSARSAAEALQVNKDTAGRYLNELAQAGFTRLKEARAFTPLDRFAPRWILTEFPYAGQPPTKDFMKRVARPKNPDVAGVAKNIFPSEKPGQQCPKNPDTPPCNAVARPKNPDVQRRCRRSQRPKNPDGLITTMGGGASAGGNVATATPGAGNGNAAGLAVAVRERLQRDRVPQRRLADHVGVTAPALAHYLAGRRTLDEPALIRLRLFAAGDPLQPDQVMQ